jgi:hypothetical protein
MNAETNTESNVKNAETNTEINVKNAETSTKNNFEVFKDKGTNTRFKRKMKQNQEVDKSLGVGSSKEKYRKYNNDSPTDIANSEPVWDIIEKTPEQKPWDIPLPSSDDESRD